MTPTSSTADPGPAGRALERFRVGISISESSDADLGVRGLGRMHLDHAFVETTRHLLAAGAGIAYGGDHRVAGFSQILFDLVRNYDLPDKPISDRIRNYLAWPLYLSLQVSDRAALKSVAKIIEAALPPELNIDPKIPVAPDTPEGRHVWCQCLTAMRRRMNDETEARVFLGGHLTGFKGRFPGLVEEVHLAIGSGKPVYLIGGFGGCTAAIIDALRGGTPETLTLDYHRAADPMLAATLDAEANVPDTRAAYAAILQDLHRTGIQGLKNGLGEAENQRLCETDDIDEMVALVLKGLAALA